MQPYIHVSWVTSEIAGKARDKMRSRYAERLPRYLPEATRTRKKLVPHLFLYWGNLVCCVMWLGNYLSVFRTSYFPHLKGYGPLNWLIHPFSSLTYDSPWLLPRRVLHKVRSSASPFNFQYPLLS